MKVGCLFCSIILLLIFILLPKNELANVNALVIENNPFYGLSNQKIKAVDLELLKELSKPGAKCIYHVDVESTKQGDNGIITDIALQNPTNKDIKFAPTATIVIGVDEIMPSAEEAGAMVNMSMGNSTGSSINRISCYDTSLFY